MKKRLHILFTGRVQGVGFRFTAENIANELGVVGWVKNLRDGRVELLVESEEENLNELTERIHKYFSQYINDMDIQWLMATGEFNDFRIKF